MKIILGEKEVQLDGISIDQYETVKNFEGDMTNSQFISILTGLEDKEIRQATVQEIGFVSKMLNSYYQKQTDKNPLKQMVEYKGQILGLEQPSTMSWGCWSDLEILTSQKPLNLKLIVSSGKPSAPYFFVISCDSIVPTDRFVLTTSNTLLIVI